jgi:mgtE-like transporter
MAFYNVNKIVKDSLPVLFPLAIISIFSGQMLNAKATVLITEFPFLLILIPPLIKVGGDTGSILGARLSSALHVGLLNRSVVRNSMLASFIVGTAACLLLGMIICIISVRMNGVGFGTLIGICMIAGILQTTIMLGMSTGVAFLSHRIGMDPDDTIIPIITTSADFIGIACILLALWLIA